MQEEEEIRNSWNEGDDSQYAQAPPRRPPKVPQSGLSGILQAFPANAPSTSQTYQYRQPNGGPQNPQQITGDHINPDRPHPSSVISDDARESASPVSQLTSRPQGSLPPYVSPPKPASVIMAQDFAYQTPQPPHPGPQPPIDHLQVNQHDDGMLTPRPSTPQAQTSVSGPDGNQSFYWHSPQASADVISQTKPSHIQSAPTKTIDDQADVSPTRPSFDSETNRSSSKDVRNSLSATTGMLNASALGFGGPSDWEYFGDYAGEEIDDTELYSKPRENKTAELPAVASPIEGPDQSDSTSPDQPKNSKPDDVVVSPKSPEIRRDQVQILPAEQTYTPPPDRAAPPPPVPFSATSGFVKSKPELVHYEASDVAEERSSRAQEDTSILRPASLDQPSQPLGPGGQQKALIDPEDPPRVQEDNIQVDTDMDDVDHQTRFPPPQSNQDTPISESHPSLGEHRDSEGDFLTETLQALEQQRDREEHNPESEHPNANSISSGATDEERNIRFAEPVEEIHLEEPAKRDDTKRSEENAVQGRHGNSLQAADASGDESGEDIIISLDHQDSPLEPETASVPAQHLSPEQPHSASLRPGRRSVFPKSIELVDPYANLDPWAKASLNRYVKMLREEAEAKVDEEKYKIFMTFTRRESRLRAVLYDADEDAESIFEQSIDRTSLVKAQSSMSLRPGVSKALPALPPEAEKPTTASSKESPGHKTSPMSHVADQLATKAQGGQKQKSTKRGSSDESYVMVDSSDGNYSPGGRPIVKRTAREGEIPPVDNVPTISEPGPDIESAEVRETIRKNDNSISPASNAPITATDNVDANNNGTQRPLSTASVPFPQFESQSATAPSIPEIPAYTPFRYEGQLPEDDKPGNRQSTFRPYSALRHSLRQSSVDGSRSIHNAPPTPRRDTVNSIASSRKDHGDDVVSDQAFNIPSILEVGMKEMPSLESALEGRSLPKDHQQLVLGPLIAVSPESSIVNTHARRYQDLKQATDAVQDDFGFIHKCVLAWDSGAKKLREQYDRERHLRQGENEQKIDALFNDNEIGYGDISELEMEFKRSEAARKTDEDRGEYQTFVSNVFDIVWSRLHYEMDQLMPLYDSCMGLVQDSQAGKEIFMTSDDRVAMAPAMDLLLSLYQKLAIRNQKAFEAVLERDRRLKKTEVAPWYALGNIAQVKQLEKRFEDAEKLAILDFCRKRDDRANGLMDVLDQNTLRGVGSNQDYMESVMQAVRKIAMEAALGAVPEDAIISSDEVMKANTLTAALARSSEQIVQTFHVADMLLNAADFEVSNANARLNNANPDTFRLLGEEKSKEDQKLVTDLEHRLALVRSDTRRTLDEITKLLSLLGGNVGGSAPPRALSVPGILDADHQVRLQKALEEAKKRNALKEVGLEGIA